MKIGFNGSLIAGILTESLIAVSLQVFWQNSF